MKWLKRKLDLVGEEFSKTYHEFGIYPEDDWRKVPTLSMQRIMQLEKKVRRLEDIVSGKIRS